ncbi:TM2 domain-containing protein almondex [Eupeodes corollae]|uniref:TM2 domain-containing protein almondex n=1 Tax=Eupeodes corollae TaxID=290404 RepID=UPI00248F72FC|nr:TM2 domain-containing protein almondex [Eupeodes corollae]
MFERRCVVINIRSAVVLLLAIVVTGIKQSQTAINTMDVDTKTEITKNNTIDSMTVIIGKTQLNESSACPIAVPCNSLTFPCIECIYNSSCIYGKDNNVTCSAVSHVQCLGERTFTKQMNCRYCYQTEHWQHSCLLRGNCNSIDKSYKTNCTAHNDVLCLGLRTFSKNVKCNWTQGYRWSTALIISLTLGGFGVDRFYLGHWPEGIGKLFSFGGLGVWTIIDVLLISLRYLGPADGSLYL